MREQQTQKNFLNICRRTSYGSGAAYGEVKTKYIVFFARSDAFAPFFFCCCCCCLHYYFYIIFMIFTVLSNLANIRSNIRQSGRQTPHTNFGKYHGPVCIYIHTQMYETEYLLSQIVLLILICCCRSFFLLRYFL